MSLDVVGVELEKGLKALDLQVSFEYENCWCIAAKDGTLMEDTVGIYTDLPADIPLNHIISDGRVRRPVKRMLGKYNGFISCALWQENDANFTDRQILGLQRLVQRLRVKYNLAECHQAPEQYGVYLYSSKPDGGLLFSYEGSNSTFFYDGIYYDGLQQRTGCCDVDIDNTYYENIHESPLPDTLARYWRQMLHNAVQNQQKNDQKIIAT